MRETMHKTDRVDPRVASEIKVRWERAAEFVGVSTVAGFVKMAATERADALIRERDTLTLLGDESAWLHAFLGEPVAEPTPAMQLACSCTASCSGAASTWLRPPFALNRSATTSARHLAAVSPR